MKFQNISVYNIQNAIRGMRNPLMSHEKSDTDSGYYWHTDDGSSACGSWTPTLGPNDYALAKRLILAGEPHRKFLRQIFVSVDLLKVPSYLMHEFATYKVGTTLDCSSTLHKITSRPLTADDFETPETNEERLLLGDTIMVLNSLRQQYLICKNENNDAQAESYFRAMKRTLPHSYLYEAMTWTANYEVLSNIYYWRHNHRLPAWHDFCNNFIKQLPYSEFITREFDKN